MRPYLPTVLSLLLAGCGDDDGTGPEPPAHLEGALAYVTDGAIVIRDFTSDETRRIELDAEGLGPVNGLAWEPDGSALVYAPFRLDPGRYELHRVPLDGSPVTIVHPAGGHEAYPDVAPDGRLAYWVNGVDVGDEHHANEIFVDGLPFSTCGLYCRDGRPAWSPDGADMVVVGRTDGMDRLIRVSVATGAEEILFEAPDQAAEQFLNPAYSRSGDRIAFTRAIFGPNQTETDEIWVVNADGSEPRRVTSGHSDDMATWSPDDEWIAFTRYAAGRVFIAIVAAGGGSVSRLAEEALVADWR